MDRHHLEQCPHLLRVAETPSGGFDFVRPLGMRLAQRLRPSGDPQPSGEDCRLTRRLVQAGAILGIDVLDHVIIGDGAADYYSFADQGRLHTDTGESHD